MPPVNFGVALFHQFEEVGAIIGAKYTLQEILYNRLIVFEKQECSRLISPVKARADRVFHSSHELIGIEVGQEVE